jgi:putative membrane protein
MMYWGNGNWSWAAWIAMTASMVLFWGLIAWAVVTVIRRPGGNGSSPEDILADRFAGGKIDDDEYRRRRDPLRSSR